MKLATLNLGDCKWPMAKEQWKAEVAEKVKTIRAQNLDPIDAMEQSLKVAYEEEYKLWDTCVARSALLHIPAKPHSHSSAT